MKNKDTTPKAAPKAPSTSPLHEGGTHLLSCCPYCPQKTILSARRSQAAQEQARFEEDQACRQKEHANDKWQSDMLEGPWLSDPGRPGKKRKAHLCAFIDDASRLLLAGRFFFQNDLPALELVFKRALQNYGIPQYLSFDKRAVYQSGHLKTVCDILGIGLPVKTGPYRPEEQGKIEAWYRFCTGNFLASLSSSVDTLEKLNEVFNLWVEREYNDRVHTKLGCTPRQRWERDRLLTRDADEEELRIAFLRREECLADKRARVSLYARKYQLSALLADHVVELRFNPEQLESVEVWTNGSFREHASEYQRQSHHSAKIALPEPPLEPFEGKRENLGHSEKKNAKAPSPSVKASTDRAPEGELAGFVALFERHLPACIYDREEVTRFWQRSGPFDLKATAKMLENPALKNAPYLHISCYLELLKGVQA